MVTRRGGAEKPGSAAHFWWMIGRALIVAGVVLVLVGLAWPWLGRVLGHLPGDLRIVRPGFAFTFPLGSSLVVSLVLTVGLTLLAWFLRR